MKKSFPHSEVKLSLIRVPEIKDKSNANKRNKNFYKSVVDEQIQPLTGSIELVVRNPIQLKLKRLFERSLKEPKA